MGVDEKRLAEAIDSLEASALTGESDDVHGDIISKAQALRELLAEVRRLRAELEGPISIPNRGVTVEELKRLGQGMRHTFQLKDCPVCDQPACLRAEYFHLAHEEFTAIRHRAEKAEAEVSRLRALTAELKAEFGSITRNAQRVARERCAKAARLAGPNLDETSTDFDYGMSAGVTLAEEAIRTLPDEDTSAPMGQKE